MATPIESCAKRSPQTTAHTGRSHFLEGLGQLAVEHGLRVSWFSTLELGHLVHGHRAEGTVAKAITRVAQVDLVIVDELGLLPISEAAAEGLYRLVDAATRSARWPLRPIYIPPGSINSCQRPWPQPP